ncbi:GMC family oxidoreductase [Gordonia sp. TBRC 11910]|uniref:GMC family oxidoreductase n=1 Tax=Gordonia asplenii TaxID=2725283 RepID=A0A848L1T6_9ACTN|nr:GMC family oxidoreductase [Gordonia asplenii]NMO04412.1 GMC family oxidoreductase [Gordonia asplenii]
MNINLPSEVDTVVVGGGTGGAAFAGMLAALTAGSVLLVEAGPDYGARESGDWPADMLSAKAIPLSHDWKLTDDAGTELDLPRARIIGGCSAHNGCTAARSAREDYDGWAEAGNPGWQAELVEPMLDWVHESLRVRRYRTEELTSAQKAFVNAGVSVGLPWADDLDDVTAGPGIGPMPVNIVDGVRWNASFAFLDPVRHLDNLTIVGDSPVRRVLFDGTTAIGVEVVGSDGERQTIRAGRVVIACGAYHSPAVLQRSGVGAASVLRAAGVDQTVDLPGVGENLLDHACVQLDFHGKDGLLEELAELEWNPDEQSLGRARSSQCDDGPYDIHVFMVAGANSGHPGLPPISLYGGAMRAKSQGAVRISGTEPDSALHIDHRYASDPAGHDRAVLGEALELLKSMTVVPELAAILGAQANSDRDPLNSVASYCHPAGTCKMGPADDPLAVVDATGAVHGVEGLYVADGSVMPDITRGNINLPIAMIGARMAAGLAGVSPAEAVARYRAAAK